MTFGRIVDVLRAIKTPEQERREGEAFTGFGRVKPIQSETQARRTIRRMNNRTTAPMTATMKLPMFQSK